MGSRKRQTPEERRIIPASQLRVPVTAKPEQLARRRCAFETPSSIFSDESHEGELLMVASPWVVLRTPTGTHGLVASRMVAEEAGAQWAVALVHDHDQCDLCADWDALPELGLGAVAPDGLGWRGVDWRIDPHPMTMAPARSWVWPWLPGTYGVLLAIHVDAPAAEIHRWLADCEPSPYRREPDAYVIGRDDRRDAVVAVEDGLLYISRSYLTHEPHQLAFDAGLCRRLAELNPHCLTWDLRDTEYLYYLAGGEDPRSLLALIDPEEPQDSLLKEYRAWSRDVDLDAQEVTDTGMLARRLAEVLHLPRSDTEESFFTELRRTPRPALPGHVRVALNGKFFGEDSCGGFFERCRELQRRVAWWPHVGSPGVHP